VQEIIDRHKEQGTTDDPEYRQAAMAYTSRWMCRLDPFPEHLVRSVSTMSQDVYRTDHAGTGVERDREPQMLGCDLSPG
jgi:hypothetical protein